MMPRLSINGGFYSCAHRVAADAGITHDTVENWLRRQMTSYGYSLTVTTHRGQRLLEETDITVIGAVQQAFPLTGGADRKHRREQMRQYAERLRATLKPT
jgi:hypothetical protein